MRLAGSNPTMSCEDSSCLQSCKGHLLQLLDITLGWLQYETKTACAILHPYHCSYVCLRVETQNVMWHVYVSAVTAEGERANLCSPRESARRNRGVHHVVAQAFGEGWMSCTSMRFTIHLLEESRPPTLYHQLLSQCHGEAEGR